MAKFQTRALTEEHVELVRKLIKDAQEKATNEGNQLQLVDDLIVLREQFDDLTEVDE